MSERDGGIRPITQAATLPATLPVAQITFQRCKLVYAGAEGGPREHALEAAETVVGAAADADIVVSDRAVSRRHFVIGRDEQRYILRDLGSTNGTLVDGVRVREAFLKPGSLIRAGDTTLRFELSFAPANIAPSRTPSFGSLTGVSSRMREVFAVLERIAPSNVTVLLQGDTGCGKSAVARAIHEASSRREKPFVVLDCGAIAANLIESELFGHEKGAFTGAAGQRQGAFEAAQGGTLFIDELTELSLALQPKLLRALEDREFTRVGSNRAHKLDCRVVVASQRDLWTEVENGRFRGDLYYRIAVVTIPLPALRERVEDIPLLVDSFLGELSEGGPRSFADLEPGLQRALLDHGWAGNVRELRNVIERLCIMGSADPSRAFLPDQLLRPGRVSVPQPTAVDDSAWELPFKDAKEQLLAGFEREYVHRLLARAHNNISQAARLAGLGRKHLYTLLARHGIGSEQDP